ALVVYEYLVTIGNEVQLFWGREITGASILFFVNRYMMLFYVLFSLRDSRTLLTLTNDASCGQYVYTLKTFSILYYIPWAGFSSLRVFALSGGNWFIAPIVFALSLGPVAINFANFHWSSIVNDPVYGCFQEIDQPPTLARNLVIISRVSLIAADLVVVAVTWFSTYRTVTMSRTVLNRDNPTFSGLLLRDGTLYFIVLLAMNVLHLAFSTSSILITPDGGGVSFMTQFAEPLTSILISRFMMNLQEARMGMSGSTSGGGGRTVSLVQFGRIVGSIGEPLEQSMAEQDLYLGDNEGSEQQKDEARQGPSSSGA
ncbi:hypothetical protein V8D89_010015, partial [Ganoderma adspersum]